MISPTDFANGFFIAAIASFIIAILVILKLKKK